MMTSRGRLEEALSFIYPIKTRVLFFFFFRVTICQRAHRTAGQSHPAENLISACSKGRHKLNHWERNEAIRLNCDGFLMRLFVLGQQVTLVLSQTQEEDGERSKEQGKRGVNQELGAGSLTAGYKKGAKLCI